MNGINLRAAGFIWGVAIILPFICFVSAVDLYSYNGNIRVFDNLGVFHMVIYFIPSYLGFAFIECSAKERLKHYIFYSLFLFILVPLFLMFSVTVICAFHGCVLP